MNSWQPLIDAAAAAGFHVEGDEDGWWVVTPHRPRHPSERLGAHHDQRAAWRAAANIHHHITSN